jgi:hypothetical protein
MKEIEKNSGTNGLEQKKEDKNKLPDSLLYPPEEDIYRKFHKESDIDPEDISKKKIPIEINNISELNQKEFDEDMSGADLDIPGPEFDDEYISTGEEDEENSHYSIGGDDHNNLEENT